MLETSHTCTPTAWLCKQEHTEQKGVTGSVHGLAETTAASISAVHPSKKQVKKWEELLPEQSASWKTCLTVRD